LLTTSVSPVERDLIMEYLKFVSSQKVVLGTNIYSGPHFSRLCAEFQRIRTKAAQKRLDKDFMISTLISSGEESEYDDSVAHRRQIREIKPEAQSVKQLQQSRKTQEAEIVSRSKT
jgi:hypothetical protein